MKIKFFLIIVTVIISNIFVACKTTKTEASKNDSLSDKNQVHTDHAHAEIPDSVVKMKEAEMKKGEKDIILEQKKQYNFKSGIIEMSNTMINGMKQTIYFDNYGAKRATYIEAPGEAGMPTSKTTIIEDKGMITVFDSDLKEGARSKASEAQIGVLATTSYLASNMTPEIMKEFDIKPIEDFTVLDKKCKGYSLIVKGIKAKVWVWERIPLYIQAIMGNDRTIVAQASSIKTDVAVPNEKFVVPKDIKIEE